MGLSTCLAANPWPALYEACSWRLWPLISEEYIFSQIISGLPSFHTHIWWSSLVLSPAGGPIQHPFPRGALATPTLAWKIPWVEEPGRLQSMGSQRVGHNWVTSLSLFTFMHWRRQWQPTPVFLPGESQGWGSLMGCRLWGRTESDTTEVT